MQGLQGLHLPGSVAAVHGLSCSSAGISPDQGPNLCLLHWQADSVPPSHRGSAPPALLVGMSSQAQSVCTPLCVVDCHNHHRGPPAGGREHRSGCDRRGRGREEAKHSEGRNQQSVLQRSKSGGHQLPPHQRALHHMAVFFSQIENLLS